MNAMVKHDQSGMMQALVPTSIAEALQLSEVFAKASLVPEHLRNKPGDCLLVVMQAQRWGMDALSVAQCTSVVRGKLCYEGKLVAAVLYGMGAIDGRLRYEFSGVGDKRAIKVSGRPRGVDTDQSVEGTVADWKTDNGNWKKSPDDMLVYRGTRQWARRYAPEALLGVYTPDEVEDATATVVSGEPPTQSSMMPRAKAAPAESNIVEGEFKQSTASQGTPVAGESAGRAKEPATTTRAAQEPSKDAGPAAQGEEPGPLSDLSPSQCKLVRAKAAAARIHNDADLLAKFPDLSKATINAALKSLGELAAA